MLTQRSPQTGTQRSLVWLLAFCAVFTKLIITCYWIQMIRNFLCWKVDLISSPFHYVLMELESLRIKELWLLNYSSSKFLDWFQKIAWSSLAAYWSDLHDQIDVVCSNDTASVRTSNQKTFIGHSITILMNNSSKIRN